MPQKITLTGKATTPVRIIREMMGKDKNSPKVYSFDMEESGSPNAAKYLPKGSNITFTVFVNEKQFTKAGLTEESLQDHKLLVQGELVLDIDLKLCPGEMGVTTNQLQIIQPKEASTEDIKEQPGQ